MHLISWIQPHGSDTGMGTGIVLPSLTPVGEIGSQIPANVYGGNSLQKPFAKMKIGESCTCMMFIDSADGCC
jgi:hypothetical protein